MALKCKIYFGYTKDSDLENADPSRVVDFGNPRLSDPSGGLKWGRVYNTNALYIKEAASDSEQDGGFGYDLGFSEDTFNISYITFSYDEAFRIVDLVKNYSQSQVSGAIEIYTRKYNFITRTCNMQGLSGGNKVSVNLTITVVGSF